MNMGDYDPNDEDPTQTTFSDPMSEQEDAVCDAITGHTNDEESD